VEEKQEKKRHYVFMTLFRSHTKSHLTFKFMGNFLSSAAAAKAHGNKHTHTLLYITDEKKEFLVGERSDVVGRKSDLTHFSAEKCQLTI
jgi:hypothetical protein